MSRFPSDKHFVSWAAHGRLVAQLEKLGNAVTLQTATAQAAVAP